MDIFFVISGYVVSASLFRAFALNPNVPFKLNLEANVAPLKAFFIKRFFRLFPVAFLLIAANMLCKLLLPDFETSFTEELMGLFSHITMQSNVDTMTFFNSTEIYRRVNHFWSMAVEERFYLIIPFLIIYCASAARFIRWAAAIIIGFAVLKGLYPFGMEELYYGAFLRFDSFMFGILVYLLQTQTNVFCLIFKKRQYTLAMNLFTILLLIMASRMPVGMMYGSKLIEYRGEEFYYFCVYTISAILVAMAAQDRGYVLNIPGLRAVFLWLANRSYSIYVFHFLYIDLASRLRTPLHIYPDQEIRHSAVLLAVTVIGSEAIYRLWERPWRETGRRIAERVTKDAGVAYQVLA